MVIFVVTLAFSLPFHQEIWWKGVLFISGTHFAIDWYQQRKKPAILPLMRFAMDQALHILFILLALMMGGYLHFDTLPLDIQHSLTTNLLGTQLLAMAFVTMPMWVLVKFFAYALVKQSGPNFPEGTSKYAGIVERLAIFTSVLWGAILLVHILAIPRLAWEWSEVNGPERMGVYLVETAVSITLTVLIGLGIRLLM